MEDYMSITAKDLAKKMGISTTAVSMALNNKPGVSTETRKLVIEMAEKYGYDFSKKNYTNNSNKMIYFIIYKAFDTVLNYHGIHFEMLQGVEEECRKSGYRTNVVHIEGTVSKIEKKIEDIRIFSVAGIILLGTTIPKDVCKQFLSTGIPVVLMDNNIDSLYCNKILINNRQGVYLATDFLIQKRHAQPGYIQSTLRLNNFNERKLGFNNAIRENGMSIANSIIHEVSPTIEGAFTDMLEIIDSGEPLANCYLAENDIIALGVIKALNLRKIPVPEQVAIIGFDNIEMCKISEPSLTSIEVPRKFMGQTAARQLIYQIEENVFHAVQIEVLTKLRKRFSV